MANDQDWALVYLLLAAGSDPTFEAECWGLHNAAPATRRNG
ncbi:MAG: hypothetical protein BWZ02_01600 [Lentisphaerae bacterium ADurb.BinA184]|nr:MAG: hypothetical protein BWZ02_01600 [Lentisphaerae bacterium ADurb.BinA184]